RVLLHNQVQLAKLAGCHVIGTCSTDEKASFLKSIGCDRPIIYTRESLDDVLTNEYPEGIDVIYESVGGEMFNTCLKQ
ncbi:zinc-binding alcohol dehydrogenase domain-containing protein 2-like, partial [Elysia marginata]